MRRTKESLKESILKNNKSKKTIVTRGSQVLLSEKNIIKDKKIETPYLLLIWCFISLLFYFFLYKNLLFFISFLLIGFFSLLLLKKQSTNNNDNLFKKIDKKLTIQDFYKLYNDKITIEIKSVLDQIESDLNYLSNESIKSNLTIKAQHYIENTEIKYLNDLFIQLISTHKSNLSESQNLFLKEINHISYNLKCLIDDKQYQIENEIKVHSKIYNP